MYSKCFIILSVTSTGFGLMGKCDHTPSLATVKTPSENKDLFYVDIDTDKTEKSDGKILYTPDQTYVLTLRTSNDTHPFRRFMITVEDPAIDNIAYEYGREPIDVGTLKTLDTDARSRYSERCASTVENTDNSDKTRIEVHWVSPKQSPKKQQVRIRAMVAENNEVWYADEKLTILLDMDDKQSRDTPPLELRETCSLCSEARYEIIFNGMWSRLTHPKYYPSKPDENGYSHMIGASHGINFTLWQAGSKASPGLQVLAQEANVTAIEREIIDAMTQDHGTRTLIRGKRRHHPYMFNPSQSLFRVDRIHHLFSIAVSLRPSPDWFLGTSKFELCKDDDWLEEHKMPLYPWDAGIVDGVSYESPKSMTQPVDNIERVEVGSFNRESPFYQLNLHDLKPFAMLHVRRLDVYPLTDDSCTEENDGEANNEEKPQEDEPVRAPTVDSSRQGPSRCDLGEWGEWSPCTPDNGVCGAGTQTRNRYKNDINISYKNEGDKIQTGLTTQSCDVDNEIKITQQQKCYIVCF